MAEPKELPELDPTFLDPRPDTDLAAFIIRSRRRNPCAERLRMDRLQHRTLAEQATISQMMGEAVYGAVMTMLDGIDLTPEQRHQARAIVSAEFAKLGLEDLP